MLEFKVSIKYILFILNYFISKKIINNEVYKIIEKEYKDLYYIINP